MDDSLYFLTILARALKQPEPQQSLEEAFAQIKRMGSQERYGEGFADFECFMDIACSHADAVDTDLARELIAELATDTSDGPEETRSLFSVVESNPVWKAEYQEMCAELAGQLGSHESVPVISVSGATGKIGETALEHIPGRASIDGVSPGVCVVRLLNTGRVLWEGQLSSEDLIWASAYGARDLDLAARTGDADRPPTRTWVLWGGDVILRTFAGVENGTIEIELVR
ncbi:MAG: hypothetical protein ABFE13_25645 [Phycisphaerales bacterium]